jgi:hypothetical protein
VRGDEHEQDFLRCRFCGGDPLEPNHEARCDGRQGGIEDEDRSLAQLEARDIAMALVADKAERVTAATFSQEAQAFIVNYLTVHGPTGGEVLTLRCAEAGIRPHDDRAFGPVFMALARAGRIIKAGSMPRALRGHHAPGCTIWRLVKES